MNVAVPEECYICLEVGEGEQCVRACDFCRGSNVHLSCLLEHHNRNQALLPKCPSCKRQLGGQFRVLFYTNQMEILEREYGPDHREIGATLCELGIAYSCLGDAEKERDLLERALAILEREYGPHHHRVGVPLFNLGRACIYRGDVGKGRDLLERALVIMEREFAIMEREYGPDHHAIAPTLAELGHAYRTMGDMRKGLDLLERARALQEREYGPEHHYVTSTLSSLGGTYITLGDAEKGRELLERALAIKEREHGPEHHDIAGTLFNLGIAYGLLGDVGKYQSLLERALAIQRREYGPDHPDTKITQEQLSLVPCNKNDSEETLGVPRANCFNFFTVESTVDRIVEVFSVTAQRWCWGEVVCTKSLGNGQTALIVRYQVHEGQWHEKMLCENDPNLRKCVRPQCTEGHSWKEAAEAKREIRADALASVPSGSQPAHSNVPRPYILMPAPRQLQVVVQPGCVGGQRITIVTPSGRPLTVEIPPGLLPGQTFMVLEPPLATPMPPPVGHVHNRKAARS